MDDVVIGPHHKSMDLIACHVGFTEIGLFSIQYG